MIKIKRFLIFCALFILIIINCGYSNIVELENRDFIIAIGIDEKTKNEFEVTTFSADMDYFQKSSAASNKKYINCARSDSINHALAKINDKLEKNMYLGHTQIIFLNKKFMNNKCIVTRIKKELRNNPQLNHKTKLIFVSNAKKIIASQFTPSLLDYIKNKLDS